MTDTRSSPGTAGLRQSLIEAICPHIKRWCDDGDGRPEPCKGCPHEVVTSQGEGVQMCRLNAEKAADDALAILDAAQRQPEPVAWAIFAENGNIRIWSTVNPDIEAFAQRHGAAVTPLYASPPLPAQPHLMPADIAQIISDGWRNGRSASEIAEMISHEMDGLLPIEVRLRAVRATAIEEYARVATQAARRCVREQIPGDGVAASIEREILALSAVPPSPVAGETERLRKGIQDYLDGNYVSPRAGREVGPQQKCPHGKFYWDACENCIDEHFIRLLVGPSMPSPEGK